MYTSKDFENMGKVAAVQYVQHNKPLNESITKMAEHYGLNPSQIARVVENANIETYLKVNNISDDKYTEFEIADPKTISANLEFKIEKDAALLNDLDNIEEKVEEYTIESGDLEEDIERKKKAQEYLIKRAEKAVSKEVDKKLEELDETFNRESANLYNLVKQASLETGNFGLVKKAMTEAVPQPLTEFIAEAYKVKLKKEAAYSVNFNDIKESPGVLNQEHPIVQSLIKLSVLKEEYSALKDAKKDLYKLAASPIPASKNFLAAIKNMLSATKNVGAGVLKATKGVGTSAKKHPGVAAVAIGAPTLVSLGIAKGRSEASKANPKVNKEYVRYAKNLKPL